MELSDGLDDRVERGNGEGGSVAEETAVSVDGEEGRVVGIPLSHSGVLRLDVCAGVVGETGCFDRAQKANRKAVVESEEADVRDRDTGLGVGRLHGGGRAEVRLGYVALRIERPTTFSPSRERDGAAGFRESAFGGEVFAGEDDAAGAVSSPGTFLDGNEIGHHRCAFQFLQGVGLDGLVRASSPSREEAVGLSRGVIGL
mmetsp:Transcript_554/g.1979  ORF Transcript_554/g.1979 Transcript_554/m.1979 type:complete len:200 (+) Transcript_554:236-835(+)